MMIAGREAAEKADVGRPRRAGARPRRLIGKAGFADFTETSVEVLGAEIHLWRGLARRGAREVDPEDRRAPRLRRTR